MTNLAAKKPFRIYLAAGAAAIAIGAAALGYYFLSPSGYLSLDVNPSIEIHTNRLHRVTSVKGVNQDAKELLEGYRLTDRDLDDVIEDLVDRMVLQGYLGNEQVNDVLITVDDDTVSQKALERVNTKIEDYLNYRHLAANVLSQTVAVDAALLKEAAQYQISAGKMSVIDRLVAGDSTLTPEDLSETRISDLVAYAHKKNISLDLLEDRLDDMEDRYHNSNLKQLEKELDRLDDDKDDLYDDDRDDRYDHDDDDWDDRNDHDDDDDDDDDDWDDRYDHDNDDDDDWDDRYDHDDDDDDWDDRYDHDDDDDDDWDDRYDHDDDDDDRDDD